MEILGQQYAADSGGRAVFSIVFDETNYNQPAQLEALAAGTVIGTVSVDFFSETPIRIRQ